MAGHPEALCQLREAQKRLPVGRGRRLPAATLRGPCKRQARTKLTGTEGFLQGRTEALPPGRARRGRTAPRLSLEEPVPGNGRAEGREPALPTSGWPAFRPNDDLF